MKIIEVVTTYQGKDAQMKLYYEDFELIRIEIYQNDEFSCQGINSNQSSCLVQEINNLLAESVYIFYFALPYNKRFPVNIMELFQMQLIPFNISTELWTPIVCPRFWDSGNFAVRVAMLMPETAVYKNNLFPRWKNKIGFSRKIFPVQPEAVT